METPEKKEKKIAIVRCCNFRIAFTLGKTYGNTASDDLRDIKKNIKINAGWH